MAGAVAFLFAEVILAVVIAFIAGEAWVRFINNFFYKKLGYEQESTLQTFEIAIFVTAALFIIYLLFIRCLIPRDLQLKLVE